MIIFGRKIMWGWNNEPTLRFGVKREKIGMGGFTAIGIYPFLVGISSRTPWGKRWEK